MKSYSKLNLLSVFIVSTTLSASAFSTAVSPNGTKASANDYNAIPPALIGNAPPLLMIDLSVELTQQAEAFTDGLTNYGSNACPDRLNGRGICYFSNFDYVGYFDPKKCYIYDTSGSNTVRDQVYESPYTDASVGDNKVGNANAVASKPNPHFFRPSSLANSDHTCNGANEWSGNFMNWATMSAIDTFRYAMTGGARMVDTIGANAQTLLIDNKDVSWSFVDKRVGTGADAQTKSGLTFDNDPRQLTPFNLDGLVAKNPNGLNHRMRFEDNNGVTVSFGGVSEFNIIVQVCDPSVSLEANCVEYTDGTNTWYKPEGLIQNNALKMRFALSSYLADNSHNRNGGVLRALAKFVGYFEETSTGGLQVNPNAEIDEWGRTVFDPDNQVGGNIRNSGVINYINNFGLGNNAYKSFDPIAELFYESLRYLRRYSPTPEYSNNLTADMYDGFPVYQNWNEPYFNECQVTNILYVGDQFAWEDNNLPGSSCVAHPTGVPVTPSNADPTLAACTLTNNVGTLENFFSGTLGSQTRGRNNNGWWIAGLAHYANTNDIRPTMPGTQTVKTYMVDTAEYSTNPPRNENNPMWLAAKFGGFEDFDGDGNPNETNTLEWDADLDGIPDTFTEASQPDKLIAGLNRAFKDVAQTVSSSSAAAVVTNASNGAGAIYQAIYEPRVQNVNTGEVVDWTGRLVSFFIDDKSRLREDFCSSMDLGSCNKRLDSKDPVIDFVVRTINGTTQTVFDRYDTAGNSISSNNSIDQLQFIWDASSQLSTMTDAEVLNQRSYNSTATADTGRYIRTWVDLNHDGLVDSGEEIDFVPGSFPSLAGGLAGTVDPRRYLGFDSTNELDASNNDLSDALVNWVRGADQSALNWRTRAMTVNGQQLALRLGDIIHSNPAAVGRPSDGYNLRYSDWTYSDFRKQYANRRQVIYVGGNDGMLHAFNGGFYNDAVKGFVTQLNSETAHPLGSELWAYIPQSVLPHLQWLPDLNYPHVYYVDGSVQAFDVNIFPSTGTTGRHPHGWGTILVATMRFGGGDITIDPNSDADGNPNDDVTLSSAVLIFDVTDPESQPKLLAEISHPELGYTTSRPALVKSRPVTTTGWDTANQKWHLVFGSGPAGTDGPSKQLALADAVSNQEARLFVVELNSDPTQIQLKDFNTGTASIIEPQTITGEVNSFVGDVSSMDWDNDYVDDTIYFGTVGGTAVNPTGHLWRKPGISSTSTPTTPTTMLNVPAGGEQPFSAAPLPSLDRMGNPWVYAGTGRFFVPGDMQSTSQQSFYGIREPLDSNGNLTFNAVNKNRLVDTSDIIVFEDGTVAPPVVNPSSGALSVTFNSPASGGSVTRDSYGSVQAEVLKNEGWYFDLGSNHFDLTNNSFVDIPGGRTLLKPVLLRDIIIFDEFTPGTNCAPDGSARLFNLNMLAGIPSPQVVLATNDQNKNHQGSEQVLAGVDMGSGQIIGLDVHKDTVVVGMGGGAGSSGFRMETQNAKISGVPFGRRSWREIPLN